jgi:hypothetical protein
MVAGAIDIVIMISSRSPEIGALKDMGVIVSEDALLEKAWKVLQHTHPGQSTSTPSTPKFPNQG